MEEENKAQLVPAWQYLDARVDRLGRVHRRFVVAGPWGTEPTLWTSCVSSGGGGGAWAACWPRTSYVAAVRAKLGDRLTYTASKGISDPRSLVGHEQTLAMATFK